MKNLIENNNSPYAIIEKDEKVFIGTGKIHELSNLEELEKLQTETRKKIVFITPFCLANIEKGYETNGEEKIIAMEVSDEINTTRDEIFELLPDENIELSEIRKNIDDETYIENVSNLKEEIENGEVCQAIISRKFEADINIKKNTLLAIYKKLLINKGQYMTYLFNTPNKTFVGASPEKHLKVENKSATMHPLAGTIPKGDFNDFYDRLLTFSEDDKEINELFMVLDEELKMMLKISENGNIEGPSFKDVGAVVHSEYELVGKLRELYSVLDALRETLYAPTLVGGPLESAFKLIKKYELDSREYYGGAFGVLEEDFLDTAIVIRSAAIDKVNNILSVRAGAGIVKDSNPDKEAKETIAKSNSFLNAIINSKSNENYLNKLSEEELNIAEKKLKLRNKKLSKFHLENHLVDDYSVEEIKGKSFKLIANGDNFVYMLGFMIEKMGGVVEIINNKDFDINKVGENEIILLGPGYGDINDNDDPRMTNLLDITEKLIEKESKILGVCLGHQSICKVKGADILKQDKSTQGLQINEKGFYNSYSPVFGNKRELIYESENIKSVQHHPESVMSIEGFDELKRLILELINK